MRCPLIYNGTTMWAFTASKLEPLARRLWEQEKEKERVPKTVGLASHAASTNKIGLEGLCQPPGASHTEQSLAVNRRILCPYSDLHSRIVGVLQRTSNVRTPEASHSQQVFSDPLWLCAIIFRDHTTCRSTRATNQEIGYGSTACIASVLPKPHIYAVF
jgi:hypothetical protein